MDDISLKICLEREGYTHLKKVKGVWCGLMRLVFTTGLFGTRPKNIPYVSISLPENMGSLFIKDKDLERFAVNILKAIKSDKLK